MKRANFHDVPDGSVVLVRVGAAPGPFGGDEPRGCPLHSGGEDRGLIRDLCGRHPDRVVAARERPTLGARGNLADAS